MKLNEKLRKEIEETVLSIMEEYEVDADKAQELFAHALGRQCVWDKIDIVCDNRLEFLASEPDYSWQS